MFCGITVNLKCSKIKNKYIIENIIAFQNRDYEIVRKYYQWRELPRLPYVQFIGLYGQKLYLQIEKELESLNLLAVMNNVRIMKYAELYF